MNYTVSVNEAKRTITVTLADGSKGVAKCCPTDSFNISTGIELALERAKNASKPVQTVIELVKALEKALPKGEMVIVGNGERLTAEQKAWLHSLTDCKGDYDEGYADGYADAEADYEECDDCEEYSEAMARIVAILDEVGVID